MTTRRKRLSLAWLLGGALGMFIIAGGVLATDMASGPQGGQLPIAWDDPDFQGSAAECAGQDPAEGTAVWHFVLTSPDAGSGHLDVDFTTDDQSGVADSGSSGGNLQWWVTSDIPNSLNGAETTDVNGNNLILSHICANPGTPDGGGSGATEDLPAGTGTVALAVLLLAIGGFGFLASTNRLPKLPKIR
jgi:hypothetical protein